MFYSPSLQLFFAFAAGRAYQDEYPLENPRIINEIREKLGEPGLELYFCYRRKGFLQEEAKAETFADLQRATLPVHGDRDAAT